MTSEQRVKSLKSELGFQQPGDQILLNSPQFEDAQIKASSAARGVLGQCLCTFSHC